MTQNLRSWTFCGKLHSYFEMKAKVRSPQSPNDCWSISESFQLNIRPQLGFSSRWQYWWLLESEERLSFERIGTGGRLGSLIDSCWGLIREGDSKIGTVDTHAAGPSPPPTAICCYSSDPIPWLHGHMAVVMLQEIFMVMAQGEYEESINGCQSGRDHNSEDWGPGTALNCPSWRSQQTIKWHTLRSLFRKSATLISPSVQRKKLEGMWPGRRDHRWEEKETAGGCHFRSSRKSKGQRVPKEYAYEGSLRWRRWNVFVAKLWPLREQGNVLLDSERKVREGGDDSLFTLMIFTQRRERTPCQDSLLWKAIIS